MARTDSRKANQRRRLLKRRQEGRRRLRSLAPGKGPADAPPEPGPVIATDPTTGP